jgi:hypothetical protein
MTEKHEKKKASKIIAGEWHAELLGPGSLHLGGAINLTPSPHAIEFSWLTFPAVVEGPTKSLLAAVIVLMAPAEVVVHEHPGTLMNNGLVTLVDLYVTRPLFSDVWSRVEGDKVKDIRFTVQEGGDRKWPISDWSMVLKLGER